MKRRAVFSVPNVGSKLAALALAPMLLVSVTGLAAQALADDIEVVERLWDEIVAKGDKDAYRRLLADEFSWTYVTGEVIDKDEAVERLTPFALPEVSKQIREYGDTAVVYGTASLTFQGRPITERFVRVWARNEAGDWQAVLFQATEIQASKPLIPYQWF